MLLLLLIIIIKNVLPRVGVIPQEETNYVRSKNGNQTSSQVSQPSGNVPLNAMALWCCTQMERRWNRKLVSR